MTKLTLTSRQAPGDILMVTAAARDLKLAFGDNVDIHVKTTHTDLWANNPYVKVLDSKTRGPNEVEMMYMKELTDSPHSSLHFVGAMHKILENRLKVSIPMRAFHADIHMSEVEKHTPVISSNLPYWIIVCGGKTDFMTKWWNPEHAQKVVDHFKGKLNFVQVGLLEKGSVLSHVHFELKNTINLINRTTLRDLVRLVYFADGTVCPVTFLMHLTAAVPLREPTDGTAKRLKPCVVVAGGREAPHWEAYPGHKFLHTMGMLDCCARKPCFARRTQILPDSSPWNMEQCARPVQVNPELRIAQCMNMITSNQVIEYIEAAMDKTYRMSLPVLT